MPEPVFGELVRRLTEAFGQQLGAIRAVPEGFLLRTSDGFLYSFVEDPARVSLNDVQRLLGDVGNTPAHLVAFTPGRLPLALTAELTRNGATVVDGQRFRELVFGLGLGSLLGEEPRPPPPDKGTRQLPSARQLDEIVTRARTWLDWGVPALGLRFYRQALELKPEFAPARNGVGRSLLALGLIPDAKKAFSDVLRGYPESLEARLGLAAVAGAEGDPAREIEIYRALLDEDPKRVEVRAHLVAALVDGGRWVEAEPELRLMLSQTPEDARLRFLEGVALEKTGDPANGRSERERARKLGLPPETERALCRHLGLPEPAREVAALTRSTPSGHAVTFPKAGPVLTPAPTPVPSRARATRRRRHRSPASRGRKRSRVRHHKP